MTRRRSHVSRTLDWLSRLSYSSVFAIWVINAVLVGFIYLYLSYIPGHGPGGIDGPFVDRLGSSLYFSIVTATTVGYGDILPLGFSRLVAALESVAGFFLFALFVAKFTIRDKQTPDTL